MRPLLLAAFLAAFFMPPKASAILDKGATVLLKLGCSKTGIFKLAKEDEKSKQRAIAMMRHLVEQGECFLPPYLLAVRLGVLEHVYENFGKEVSEIWRVEGAGDVYIIAVDPRQKSSFI